MRLIVLPGRVWLYEEHLFIFQQVNFAIDSVDLCVSENVFVLPLVLKDISTDIFNRWTDFFFQYFKKEHLISCRLILVLFFFF